MCGPRVCLDVAGVNRVVVVVVVAVVDVIVFDAADCDGGCDRLLSCGGYALDTACIPHLSTPRHLITSLSPSTTPCLNQDSKAPLPASPSVQRRCMPSRSRGWLPGGTRSSCSVPSQVWLRFRFGRGGRWISCPIDELRDLLGAGGGSPDAGTDEDGSAVPGTSWLHHRGWVAGGVGIVCCLLVLFGVVRCSLLLL